MTSVGKLKEQQLYEKKHKHVIIMQNYCNAFRSKML